MERNESYKDLVECCDHPLHDVSGDVIIRDRLTVCGNLRAHKVDPAERGLFLTEESLKESCTVCRKGDWALVGTKSPFDVYRWDNGWYKTDVTHEVIVPLENYLEEFETKLKVLGENAEEIAWNDTCNMNNYKTAGTYRITGERTNKADNLPIGNANPGHTIDGVLYVLNSSLPNGGVSEDDKCVTQFLMLSNRVGGQEGDMYMRSGYGLHTSDDSFTWKPWEKFQTNIEVGVVSDDATHDPSNFAPINANGLNSLVDNGIYSGVYLTEEALSGDSTKAQTFVMVVINNYAAAGDYKTFTQIKFAVTNAGEYSMERRSRGFDGKWSGWINEYNDLSTRMDEAELRIGEAEKNIALNTAEIDQLKERNLAEIPTFTGVVDSTEIVPAQIATQFLGVYYIKSKNVFAALNGDNYYTGWQAQGMFQSSKCYNQNGVAVENRIYYLKDMFDTGKAPSLVFLKSGSFVEVNDNADVEEAITSLQERAVLHEDSLTTKGKQIATLQTKVQDVIYTNQDQQEAINAQAAGLAEAERRIQEHTTQIGLMQEEVDEVEKKQLSLSVKDNGNIILSNTNGESKEFMPATPSGDPMHEAYRLLGGTYYQNAVYNNGEDVIKKTMWESLVDDADYNAKWGLNLIPDDATFVKTLKYNGVDREVWEFGNPLLSGRKVWAVAEYASDGTKIWDDKVYVSRGGMWSLASLGDLTNADMRKILLSPYVLNSEGSCASDMGRVVCKNGTKPNAVLAQYFLDGQRSEVLMFGYIITSSVAINILCKVFLPYEILSLPYNFTALNMQYCKMKCVKTATMVIPKISVRSIIYALNKTTESVTITFPSALYDRLMDTSTTLGAELVALLESKSNITFARGE